MCRRSTIANGKQVWNVVPGRTLTLAGVPTKPGQPAPNNAGVLQLSTTGRINLGTTTNLIADNEGNPVLSGVINSYVDGRLMKM